MEPVVQLSEGDPAPVEKLTLPVPRNILPEVVLSAATMSPGCDAEGKGKLRCAACINRPLQ